ncbi:hypothetical protein T01_1086 [Trichinella spiralis]|uniref:Uncharacterized protein n=1 Tax=Trichinella spiralis TaxID=6334 RepID=A0A0V1BUZ7_TRISP|nr:hypothetical protein T01_1086 [Trichinella spiralis]
MSEYRHITQLMTNIIWDVILVKYHANVLQHTLRDECNFPRISRAVLSRFELRISFFTSGSVPNLFNCTCQPLLLYFRCEVLDQLESTQQNRSQPGQIKAQLIILIDKRRLHAWRQISLRKIDEQFLMKKLDTHVCVIHSVLTSSQQAAMCQVGTRSMRIIFTTIIFKSFDQRLVRSSVD